MILSRENYKISNELDASYKEIYSQTSIYLFIFPESI